MSIVLLALAALAAAAPIDSTAARADDNRPFWTGLPDAATFDRGIERRLDQARRTLDQLLSVKGRRTVANTLEPYDRMLRDLDGAGGEAGVIAVVHPDSAMRSVAEAAKRRVETLSTEVSLNRPLFDALQAIDTTGADGDTRYYLERTLRDFRLAGVNLDDSTRVRVRALRDEVVQIGQEFNRNIVNDVRRVTVSSLSELEGLPPDFIANHPAGTDGKIVLTTDYPDAFPVFDYARSDDLRRRMRVAFDSRAYPVNMTVLDRLIAKRAELARLLGFASWADYTTADKMVGSAAQVSEFLDQVAEASSQAASGEYEMLLARKRRDDPSATVVNRWERNYLLELLRREKYQFDSQRIRPYFAYDSVKQGLLDLSAQLFGVTFKRMKNPPVWHASVEGYEMFEGGKLTGRFYLDMHPRPGKYKHAAQYDIRSGVAGERLPEAALLCNLPGGTPGDPELLGHDEVVTLFHEFGHLMHTLLGGRQRWVGLGPSKVEWDFIEAPSQMLEEWTWDPRVLARFARHYQTGDPIPADLVRQMKEASELGRALQLRQQLAYARLSLALYDRPPSQANTDSLTMATTREFTPFPPVPDTHYQASFSHLDGYSAIYYTYMWSLVIAKDMFSRFDRANLLAPEPARRYRDAILQPGGSAPVGVLLARYLERPFNFDAWRRWVDTGE